MNADGASGTCRRMNPHRQRARHRIAEELRTESGQLAKLHRTFEVVPGGPGPSRLGSEMPVLPRVGTPRATASTCPQHRPGRGGAPASGSVGGGGRVVDEKHCDGLPRGQVRRTPRVTFLRSHVIRTHWHRGLSLDQQPHAGEAQLKELVSTVAPSLGREPEPVSQARWTRARLAGSTSSTWSWPSVTPFAIDKYDFAFRPELGPRSQICRWSGDWCRACAADDRRPSAM